MNIYRKIATQSPNWTVFFATETIVVFDVRQGTLKILSLYVHLEQENTLHLHGTLMKILQTFEKASFIGS